MRDRLRFVNRLFRVSEWYDSKVPMLIMPALWFLLTTPSADVRTCMPALAVLMIFDMIFPAFGYIINDYADLEADRLAGKDKPMHHMKKETALLLVTGTGVLACLPVLLFSHTRQTLLALALIYFFGMSYSAPPLRFKERGVLGLLVSSTAQRCFPLLLVPALFENAMDIGYLLWMLLSFFVGLRYILVHQYLDAENDRRSGVNTFALRHQAISVRLIRCAFAAELILLAAIWIPVCRAQLWVIGFFAVYAWIFAVRWKGCKMVFGHGGLYSFDQMPLEDFYNHLAPLILILLLMQSNPRWGGLLALWIAVLLRPAAEHLKFPIKIWKDQRKRKEAESYEG